MGDPGRGTGPRPGSDRPLLPGVGERSPSTSSLTSPSHQLHDCEKDGNRRRYRVEESDKMFKVNKLNKQANKISTQKLTSSSRVWDYIAPSVWSAALRHLGFVIPAGRAVIYFIFLNILPQRSFLRGKKHHTSKRTTFEDHKDVGM